MIQKTRTIELVAAPADSGMRFDLFLSNAVDELTRSSAKRLIEDGQAKVGGLVKKASYSLQSGDLIEVNILPPDLPSNEPESIPLDIIFEDEDVVVVNKAAGMVVHPAVGNLSGTLVNALLAHCGDLSSVGGEIRSGIVHRLDKGTSGLIIAAKNDRAHLELSKQFELRKVKKIYGALVLGHLRFDEGSFDSPIGRSSRNRKKISSNTSKAREAHTKWKVLERFGKMLSWVEVRILTGRTHQIRVHFSEAGNPLVGDEEYGGRSRVRGIPDEFVREMIRAIDRPMLHSWKLEIAHPKSGEMMKFEAPLPADIAGTLEGLRAGLGD